MDNRIAIITPVTKSISLSFTGTKSKGNTCNILSIDSNKELLCQLSLVKEWGYASEYLTGKSRDSERQLRSEL